MELPGLDKRRGFGTDIDTGIGKSKGWRMELPGLDKHKVLHTVCRRELRRGFGTDIDTGIGKSKGWRRA
jgi:hypothetical protein